MTESYQYTWESAVRWYRAQPGNEAAILSNYFDLPVRGAAERYAAGEEFAEVSRVLGPGAGRRVLDLGAGHGIASYALARACWRVAAFEPDPSTEVGAGAIAALRAETGLPIEPHAELGPRLPFDDASMDAIFVRQVLHHVPDLRHTMRDLFRVLRHGGRVLAIREHVADDAEQLAAFRARHPLHHLYGGENAHPLPTYLGAATDAGFQVEKVWGSYESILNFFPGSEAERQAAVRGIAARRFRGFGKMLLSLPGFVTSALTRFTHADKTPGRIYSFLLLKP